jgi:pimeloyl-ACP methyl ester carboxylesterase
MIDLITYISVLLILAVVLCAIFTRITSQNIKRSVPKFGKTTALQDAEIHWHESGQGKPIIMLHGLAGNLRNFTYALVEKLDQDYRIIVIDRAGCGWSKRLKSESATLQEQARIISEFIDKEQIEKPLIVGHSLGGAIALTLALEHRSKISGLALISPATQIIDKIPEMFKFLNISSPLIRFFVAHIFSSLIGILTRKETFKAAFSPEAICDDFRIKGGGDLALSSEAFIRTSEDLIFAQSSAPSLVGREKELDVYTEVLFGEDDEILDAKLHGEKFAKLAGAELTTVPGAGHMLPLTIPDKCASFIRGVMNNVLN